MKKALSFVLVVFMLLSNSCVTTGGGSGRQVTAQSEEKPLNAIKLPLQGEINEDTAIPLALAIVILNQIDENRPDVIIIEIDSPGGEVGVGFQLAKVIEDSSIPIVCAVDGEADSMAFFILQSCPIRLATPRSKLMIHGVTIVGPVNQQTLPMLARLIEVYNEMLIQHIVPRMKVPEAEIRKKIDEGDWWMTAAEGVEFGALDGLIEKI